MLKEIMQLRANLNLTTTAVHLRNIINSANAATVKILYDHNNCPCGYILWANVNKESARIVLEKGRYPRFPYEWNEGRFVLIFEVIIMTDALPSKFYQLRDFLRQHRAVLFVRNNSATLYVRRRQQIIKTRYPLAVIGAETLAF